MFQGMEKVRVLVRGRLVLQPGNVRPRLQPRQYRHPSLARYAETNIQPTAGRARGLRHSVSFNSVIETHVMITSLLLIRQIFHCTLMDECSVQET